jgi:hypothetical protein
MEARKIVHIRFYLQQSIILTVDLNSMSCLFDFTVYLNVNQQSLKFLKSGVEINIFL